MTITAKTVLCALLIMCIAVPVVASPAKQKASGDGVASTVYRTGANALDQGEGLISGCLKRTFSVFNPCLDVVKGCTDVVLAPLGKPFDYVEGAIEKRWHGKKAKAATDKRSQ